MVQRALHDNRGNKPVNMHSRPNLEKLVQEVMPAKPPAPGGEIYPSGKQVVLLLLQSLPWVSLIPVPGTPPLEAVEGKH